MKPENTHHRGKYHCSTADLLFDWLGFDQKSQTVFDPNKIKSR